MAKQKTAQKSNQKTETKDSRAKNQHKSNNWFDLLNAFFDKRLNMWLWLSLGLALLFSLLLFDSKVSLSGDDAFYIKRAYDLIHSFAFPSFQGPLYPTVLSVFVAIFGINLVPLKMLSMLSMLGFIYLWFRAFRNRVPAALLVFSTLIVSINSFILYYASQTYSEAFYLLMVSVLLFVFFKYFIDQPAAISKNQLMMGHLFLALSLLAVALTRSVGFSAIAAVGGYFLLKGEWRNLLYFVVAFLLVFLLYQLLKYMLWGDAGLQFSSQGSGLLNKDYYNPAAGKEDFAGMLKRLFDNSNLYFSKHLAGIFGLREYSQTSMVRPMLTLAFYLLALGSLLLTFRQNKFVFFTALLAGAFCLVSFVALQAKWDQSRLIIPATPMLLLVFMAFFYYAARIPKFRMFQFLLPLLAAIIFISTFAITLKASTDARAAAGRYGGLTPDWKNYLKASEWAAENLPNDAVIACRKPSISFVYGKGRNFYGIMQLPTYKSETFVHYWNTHANDVMLLNYEQFAGKQVDDNLYKLLKQNYFALVFVGEKGYFAEKSESAIIILKQAMDAAGVKYYSSFNDLQLATNAGLSDLKVYYPDSLLNTLKINNVTHVMTANLRRNAAVKDGTIINTVERYFSFIQEKYPMIFTKIVQAGDDDNEPAVIYRIDYPASAK